MKQTKLEYSIGMLEQAGACALSSDSQDSAYNGNNSPSLLRTNLHHNGILPKQDRYYPKYKRLKRLVKQTVFLNAAICDEVVRLEEKISRVKEERKYLVQRLLQHQVVTEGVNQGGASTAGHAHSPAVSTPSSASSSFRSSSQSVAQLLGEAEKRKKKVTPASSSQQSATGGGVIGGSKGKKKLTKEPLAASSLAPNEPKPKGKKAKAMKRYVTPIPLDNTGRPLFPIELGTLTVYCLGEIIPKPTYHSAESIYPVGFCSTREFVSIMDPSEKCLYTCKVTDDDNAPIFEVSGEDSPHQIITGPSPDVCHLKLLHVVNSAMGGEALSMNVRGAEFFGLSHPTIQNLIQYCPGAKKCTGYRWTKFEIAKDGSPHIEDEITVNVQALMMDPVFQAALTNREQRLGVRSGSLRNLLTTDM